MNRLEDTVKDVEFIFESIIENLEAKQSILESIRIDDVNFDRLVLIFVECVQYASSNAIICTSTMRLDLDKLSENLPHKEVNLVETMFSHVNFD